MKRQDGKVITKRLITNMGSQLKNHDSKNKKLSKGQKN